MAQKKVAVVTGGANGIGAGIARRLAADGFSVAVADRDFDGASTLAAGLNAAGHAAQPFRLDVSSPESVAAFFQELDRAWGRCDALVNNAGVGGTYGFDELTLETWTKTLAVNVTGMLLMSQHASARMRRERWGRVVNLSSVSGVRASWGRTAYGTSKAAILGLTRQMAIELADHGIVVNAILPGPIETPLTAAMHTASARAAWVRAVPLHRYGLPSEVAGVASFLCGPDASYVTGAAVPVDGGLLAAGNLQE